MMCTAACSSAYCAKLWVAVTLDKIEPPKNILPLEWRYCNFTEGLCEPNAFHMWTETCTLNKKLFAGKFLFLPKKDGPFCCKDRESMDWGSKTCKENSKAKWYSQTIEPDTLLLLLDEDGDFVLQSIEESLCLTSSFPSKSFFANFSWKALNTFYADLWDLQTRVFTEYSVGNPLDSIAWIPVVHCDFGKIVSFLQ